MANPLMVNGALSAISAVHAGYAEPIPTPKIKAARCIGIALLRKKNGKTPKAHKDKPARIIGILPNLSDNLPARNRGNTDPTEMSLDNYRFAATTRPEPDQSCYPVEFPL